MKARPLVVGLDAVSANAVRDAFQAREAIALISDRYSEAERDALTRRIATASVPDDTALVVFTSGSTGRPKGVVLSFEAAHAAVRMSEARLGCGADRWLLALSPAQVGGVGVLMRCLLGRVPLSIAPRGDAASVAAALAAHQPTLVSLVPTQLAGLLDDPGWRPPPTLRAVLLGGAAAPASLLAMARERRVPVLTTYGMSETFGQAATASPGELVPAGAVGRALDGVTIRAGTRADPSTIVIDTPAAFSGYLDDPADTAARGLRPVVTADLGFVEDGWLHVSGRGDDVIVTGGHKVHPAPIEAALVHPGVAAVAVVGIPDGRWGQTIAAAVVPRHSFTRTTLDAAIAALPAHTRPRQVAIVNALPMLPSGKVDRIAIAAIIVETMR